MHEAGIAQNLLEICEEEARKHAASSIVGIKLRLGEFTGVVREALEFAFEALKPGTLAANARLEIEIVPLIAACPACGVDRSPQDDICLLCPACGGALEIRQGREMQLEYLELEQEEETSCSASQ